MVLHGVLEAPYPMLHLPAKHGLQSIHRFRLHVRGQDMHVGQGDLNAGLPQAFRRHVHRYFLG